MNDFEKRLRQTPRKMPSPELDRRIEELLLTTPAPSIPVWRSVGIQWAAAACLVAGFVGFIVGSLWQKTLDRPTVAARPPVTFQVICTTPGSNNPFDFTSVDNWQTTQHWTVKTSTNKGNQL
jgi:hypothetical protein